MDKLGHHEVIVLLLQLSTMLVTARAMAELAKLVKQPAVVGEILAGVLLGPTIFGAISPDAYAWLFPLTGPNAFVLDGFIQVGVVLLLFIAGLEVDLQVVWAQGKQAVITSLFALLIPFAIGFAVAYLYPDFFGNQEEDMRLVFALFLGTVIAITALPVIARVLMDLNVFNSPMGMLIIASAMIIDILGWLIFAVILSMMGSEGQLTLWQTIGLTLLFSFGILSVGRSLIDRVLPWVNRKLAWPGGVFATALALCFIAASFTEYIGIHSIFGAFMIGVALGDSQHFTEKTKEILHQFINNIFAPLFFASIGLYIDFVSNFDPLLVGMLILIAFVAKTLGATLGAKASGLHWYTSLAVGSGMNTHGTLEVILGAIALQAGLISERVFVAIVIMVIVTILVAAPLMGYWLKRDKQRQE